MDQLIILIFKEVIYEILHNETNYPEFAIEEQGEMFKEWLQDKKSRYYDL